MRTFVKVLSTRFILTNRCIVWDEHHILFLWLPNQNKAGCCVSLESISLILFMNVTNIFSMRIKNTAVLMNNRRIRRNVGLLNYALCVRQTSTNIICLKTPRWQTKLIFKNTRSPKCMQGGKRIYLWNAFTE